MRKFAIKIVWRQNSVYQYFGIQIHILGVLFGVLGVLFGVPGVLFGVIGVLFVVLGVWWFVWRTLYIFWCNWYLWHWDIIFVTFRIRDGASNIFLTKKCSDFAFSVEKGTPV